MQVKKEYNFWLLGWNTQATYVHALTSDDSVPSFPSSSAAMSSTMLVDCMKTSFIKRASPDTILVYVCFIGVLIILDFGHKQTRKRVHINKENDASLRLFCRYHLTFIFCVGDLLCVHWSSLHLVQEDLINNKTAICPCNHTTDKLSCEPIVACNCELANITCKFKHYGSFVAVLMATIPCYNGTCCNNTSKSWQPPSRVMTVDGGNSLKKGQNYV